MSRSAGVRIDEVFASQRAASRAAKRGYAERREAIRRLHDAMLRHQQEIRDAMFADFRKPPEEVDLSEIYVVTSEARHALRHLRRWMRAQRVSAPLALIGSRSRIEYEPKGVVLIVSPWNFPFNLTFGPLVSALAAGNRAILKPSELTPHSSALIARIVAELYDESEVAVVEGGADVAADLVSRPFDHIFFTGSTAVGRIVMRAAAENLTPVTLELGGKSPAIVDETADVEEAAKKIAWGKLINSGQTCIAPDYVLVHDSIRTRFVAALQRQLDAMLPQGGGYSWLVNERHLRRMEALAGRDARSESSNREMKPMLLDAAPDDPVWKEEIFGPLLPLRSFRSLDEALELVRSGEKPLVLYLFSRDRARVRKVLDATSSGSASVNDTLVHFYQVELPFGGIGASGSGKAHGRFGFETFSNVRGVFTQPFRWSATQLMYPPYDRWKRRLIDFTVRWL